MEMSRADEPELARELPLKFRMQHALRSGGQTYAALANACDDTIDNVSKTARRHDGKLFTRLTGPDGVSRVALLAREASA
jgi:hypothetical protein